MEGMPGIAGAGVGMFIVTLRAFIIALQSFLFWAVRLYFTWWSEGVM